MIIKYLLVINIIGFLICCLDKIKAIKHKYRISEITLLLICLIGGCFGFLLGMILTCHKIRKNKFKILIPIMILIWLILLNYI